MRIGTYNVLGLTGYPAEESRKQIDRPGTADNVAHFTGVFSELACDVLGLEEGVAVGHMQKIALGLGRHLATFPSPIAWPGHVLSRYPVVESRVFSHRGPDEEVPPFSRTAGAALLEIDAHTRLWFVVLHLHPGIVELRNVEADIIRDRLTELLTVTDNAILVGDLNCEIEERLHGNLKEMQFANAMETVGGGIQLTMDTVGIRPHSIDHIYVSPSLAGRLRSAEVVRRPGFRHDGPQAEGVWVHSDHLPVVADLDWPE